MSPKLRLLTLCGVCAVLPCCSKAVTAVTAQDAAALIDVSAPADVAFADTDAATPAADTSATSDASDSIDAADSQAYAKAPPLPPTVLPAPRFVVPTTAKAGKYADGLWILPNGRFLTPTGQQVDLQNYPLGLAVHPNGNFIYISNDLQGSYSVDVVNTVTLERVQTVSRQGLYRFLAVTADGHWLYASGGPAEPCWRFAIDANGLISQDREYAPTKGFYGLAPSPDGKYLYGLTSYADNSPQAGARFVTLNADTGAVVGSVNTATTPYDLKITADGKSAFVLTWAQGNLQRIDLANPASPTVQGTVSLGFSGQGLGVSADGQRVWASAVESDEVVEIDGATLQILKRIPLNFAPVDQPHMAPTGRDPGWMAMSPDGKRLYVVCAMSDDLAVIDTQSAKLLGSVPVGWFPSAVAVSPDGQKVYVANAKGTGLPPWDGNSSVESKYLGTMSVFAAPTDAQLQAGAKDLLDNLIGVSGLGRLQPSPEAHAVLPDVGGSPQIQHVVYIMRENKTFDVELGDLAGQITGVVADPQYALYGQTFTPNLHALAQQYCLLDNFYTDGDYSATGHGYATAAKPSDYIEKHYGIATKGVDVAWNVGNISRPGQGFLFSNVLAWGLDTASFGEIVGMVDDFLVNNVLQPDYPGVIFNLEIDDEAKADYFATWLKTHLLPRFTFILLPNNHTCCGASPNHVSPRSMVADNDLGTGKVIEAITHSPYWSSSAIFLFEDDPQDGGDSVEYHRSPLLVISPWVKPHSLVHDHHATGSIHATTERILGTTPLTELDALASPIYGCFTNQATLTPYEALPRLYPPTLNSQEKGKKLSKAMKKQWKAMDFSRPDAAPGLGRLLWQMYRGTKPPWPDYRFDRQEMDDDDDEVTSAPPPSRRL